MSDSLELYIIYQYLVSLTDVYLSLNGAVIPNNGYVEISDIGSMDDSALLCHTNRPATQGNSPNLHSGGDWHAPNGNRVGITPPVPGVTRSRGSMVVRLGESTGTPLEGIYRCEIEDADDTLQTVYVGLYNAGAGRVIMHIIIPYATVSLFDCRGH